MPETVQFIDNLATIHFAGRQTDGRFGLVEMLGRPGDQPPLHVHHDEDEGFHVVDGELTIWAGDEAPRVLGPGESLVAPRAVPHTYRVTSDATARWFVTSTPARFATFVAAFGQPTDATELWAQPAGPPDLERLVPIAAANGIEILGPPGMLPSALADVAAG